MSPGNEQRPRLGTESVAEGIATNDETKSTAPTDNLAVTRRDWDQLLAKVAGPDDPTFRAASLLADAWAPALAAADRLGYERGLAEGVVMGRAEEAEAWQKIMGVWRQTVATPTQAELSKRRGESP